MAEDFSGILKDLSRLTVLNIYHVLIWNATRLLDCIFSMPNLKVLTFVPTWLTAQQICPPTHMSQMQLTKLSWSCKVSLLQMMCLTEITHFDIQIWDQNCHEDLVRLLVSMPNLQWLKITSHNGLQFWPSHFLSRMRTIRGLDLRRVDADGDIYQTLATLPELIELNLHFQFTQNLPTSTAFHSEISLLTNLRSLGICINPRSRPDGLLDGLLGGNLVRLQTLCVPSPDLSDHRAVLFKSLPSLRRFS